MKKFISKVLGFLGALLLVVVLAACNIKESTAEKINEAFEAGEPWTYEEVIDKLGEPTEEVIVAGNGMAMWYKGYDSVEEAMEAYEEGKTLKAIMVTFAGGKAIAAEYEEGNKDDE